MSVNINRVILGGRITKDPEVKYTNGKEQNQVAVVRFSLAIKNKYNREETDFISCVAFGKTAEFVEKNFKKGDSMVAYGKIQPGSYVNNEGKTVYTFDINVNEVDFGGNKRTEQNQAANQQQNVPNQNVPQQNNSNGANRQPSSNPNGRNQGNYQQRNNGQGNAPQNYNRNQQNPQNPNNGQAQMPQSNQGANYNQNNYQNDNQNNYQGSNYYDDYGLEDGGYFDNDNFDLGLQ